MAELKATPRNSALGAIADALMRARELGDKAKIPFTELGLGELVFGKTPEELNEWSYGNAPLRVAGRGTGSLVPQLKQGRAEQVADTMFTLPGAGPLAKASARAVKSVPGAVRHGAEQFAHASAAANPRVVKKPGGNWLHSEGTEYLDELVNRGDNPAIGDWVRGPLRRYVRKDLGAETDPLLKLADEGISPLPESRLAYVDNWTTQAAARNRAKSGLQQPSLSPRQQAWADNVDSRVLPQELGGVRTGLGDRWKDLQTILSYGRVPGESNSYWPKLVRREGEWLGKLPDEEKLYQFAGDEAPFHLGFDRTVNALRQGMSMGDLPPHLALSPEKLKQMGIEKAVRYQNELDTFLKNRDVQELLEAGRSPVYGGRRLKEFDNGYYITELGLPEALTEDMQKLVRQNPDGTWTALTPSGKPMQRRLTPGSESPLVEVVEDTPERAILGGALGHEGRIMDHCVGGYCGEVAEGRTRILSLRDPEGKSHVTFEVEQPADLELQRKVKELQDAHTKHVQEVGIDDALDFPSWLEENAPEMMRYGPDVFDNDAVQPMVRQVYGAANSTPKDEYKALASQYLKEAGLTGDDYAMRNAGLELVDGEWVPTKVGGYKDGGLVETDDFAYPGMF